MRFKTVRGALRDQSGIYVHADDPAGASEPVAGGSGHLINGAGRFYCRTSMDWVTESDDNFGASQFQYNEYCGTGATPIIEWEHMGILVPAGYRVKALHIAGWTNSTEVTDMELFACVKTPDPVSRWETGFDSDTEVTATVLHHDNFDNPNSGTDLTGDTTDLRCQSIALDHEITQKSMLSIYMKPIGTLTAQRYFRATYSWELEAV